MSDVRRLMGRLNAPSARFDMRGGGGIPELTSLDIAGALAMIGKRDPVTKVLTPDVLAREVFCACWWPAGAELQETQLLRLISMRQSAQLYGQMERVQRARLELHCMLEDIQTKGTKFNYEKEAVRRLQARLDEAKKEAWPGQTEMYGVIRMAALRELTSPNHCKECGGRGEMIDGNVKIVCRQCDGTGSTPISDRQRAIRIDRDHKTYRDVWKPMYEWTYTLLRDAEFVAIQSMREALR